MSDNTFYKIYYDDAIKYLYSTDNVLRSDHSWWGSITLGENLDVKPENDPNLDIEDVVD